MSGAAWLSMAGAAGQLVLIAFVALQRRSGDFSRALIALSSVFLGWTYAAMAYGETQNPYWHAADLALSPWAPSLGLMATAAFVGTASAKRFVPLALVGSAVISVMGLMTPFGQVGIWIDTRLWSIGFVVLLTGSVLRAVFLLWRYLAHSPNEKVRSRWILVGLVLAGLLGLTELSTDFGWAGVPRLGHLATLLSALIFVWLGVTRGLIVRAALPALLPGVLITFIWTVGHLVAASIVGQVVFVVGAMFAGLAIASLMSVGAKKRRRRRDEQAQRFAFVGRMSAQLAHDLRNPLGAMAGAVDFMQEQAERGEELDPGGVMVELLSAQIERLRELTDRYVRLTRIDDLRLEPAALRTLLTTAAELADVDALRVSGTANPPLNCDVELLTGALSNLLANARDADPNGQIETHIITHDNEVQLEILDRGPGMNPREIEQAIHGFYTTKNGGTGLGLSFAAAVVRAHQGRIEFEYEERGFVCRVFLPRTPSPAE